jgi:hypothetical protein
MRTFQFQALSDESILGEGVGELAPEIAEQDKRRTRGSEGASLMETPLLYGNQEICPEANYGCLGPKHKPTFIERCSCDNYGSCKIKSMIEMSRQFEACRQELVGLMDRLLNGEGTKFSKPEDLQGYSRKPPREEAIVAFRIS